MKNKHPDTLQLRFRTNNERHELANQFLRNCGKGNATAAVVLLVEEYLLHNPQGLDMNQLKILKKETPITGYQPKQSIEHQEIALKSTAVNQVADTKLPDESSIEIEPDILDFYNL